MFNYKYFVAIIMIVIIILINYYYTSLFITGIWVVADTFAKSADLDELILYIDYNGNGTLYIDSGDDVVDKKISVITYPLPWSLITPGSSSGYMRVNGTDGIWADYMYYELDSYRGELILKKDDEVYARLKKDYISEL